jgi:2',3'-cyclic-nucleotide 2'-phosphodiesterase (5'-nucleotidase family)
MPATVVLKDPEDGEFGSKDIVILFTSDVHGSVDSGWTYSGVDVIRKQLIAKGNNVILVDNGDSISMVLCKAKTEKNCMQPFKRR